MGISIHWELQAALALLAIGRPVVVLPEDPRVVWLYRWPRMAMTVMGPKRELRR